MRERIELLVTVKAYPNISQKYGEVVCVAGIRTDVEPHRWVRLFPIHFRDLAFSKRFGKYQQLGLDAEPHSGDARPESMRPNTDSLAVGEKLDTRKKWAARRAIVEPLMIDSMCELQRRQAVDQTSLGVFRPADVSDFTIEVSSTDWDPAKQAVVNHWRDRYAGEVIPRLRERWLNEMCGEGKDTAFFVGNQHQHPESLLVLGVFWPPRT